MCELGGIYLDDKQDMREKRRLARPLHRAIAANDLLAVRTSLSTPGADVNFRHKQLTPLWDAVQRGLADVVTLLIAGGADLCDLDPGGRTLLHAAVPHAHVVDLLIAAGVDVDTTDHLGVTPVSLAVSTRHPAAVAHLLTAAADVNRRDARGQSPLVLATELNDGPMVEALLAAEQCDVNSLDSDMKTPLIIAVERAHTDIVALLLSVAGCEVDAADMYGRTALYFAAHAGRLDIVKQLIKAGAALDKADTKNFSPLTVAVAGCHVETARLLAASGCHLDLTDHDTAQTPLHLAIRLVCNHDDADRLATVAMLLSSGCDANAPDKHGWTPVHQAAFAGDDDLVRRLLSRGVAIDTLTESCDTPLHAAVVGNNVAVMRQLLNAGCKVNCVNKRNELPLYNAVDQRMKIELIHLLLDAGSRTDVCQVRSGQSPLFAAIAVDYDDAVDALLKAGTDVNCPNAEGDTPLWVACNRGNAAVVATLLLRADVQLDAGTSHVPLHAAVLRGREDIARLLIDAGCDVNKLTELGVSALYFAAFSSHLHLVRLLLRHGADPRAALAPPGACCRHYSDAHPHLESSPFYAAVQSDSPPLLATLWAGSPRPPYATFSTLRDLVFRTAYAHEARVPPETLRAFAACFAQALAAPRRLLVLVCGEVSSLLRGRSADTLPLPDALKARLRTTAEDHGRGAGPRTVAEEQV